MKQLLKVTLKNATIEDGEDVIVKEYNSKDELIGEMPLETIYNKFEGMCDLRINISTGNSMNSKELKTILDEFIGKEGLNITIQNETEI